MQRVSLKGDEMGGPTHARSASSPTKERYRPSGRVASSVPEYQTTLARSIDCQGVALHSGLNVTLRLSPAPANSGVLFQRIDLADSKPFEVTPFSIVDTRLSTVVAPAGDMNARVATIEHLMAALHALAIDNVLVSVSGPELPVLDGSSEAFAFLIRCAGKQVQDTPRSLVEIMKSVRVEGQDGAFAELRPARQGLTLQVSIDFDAEAIGRQNYSLSLSPENFMQEVSYCRTFVYRRDIEALQKIGLARGGSLDNAVVVDGADVLNPAGLKVRDEFVRHKLLDAVGDLYCAGHRIQGHFTGHKCGHDLNNRLLRAVFSDETNWRNPGTSLSARRMPMRHPESVAA